MHVVFRCESCLRLLRWEWPVGWTRTDALNAAVPQWAKYKSAAGEILTAAQAAEIGSTTFMFFCADGVTAIFKVATVISLEELFVISLEDLRQLALR